MYYNAINVFSYFHKIPFLLYIALNSECQEKFNAGYPGRVIVGKNLRFIDFAANPKLGGKPHFNGATCRL